jgi:hypothetical protein
MRCCNTYKHQEVLIIHGEQTTLLNMQANELKQKRLAIASLLSTTD